MACAACLAAGCGKKGPPLAPLLRVPAQVSEWTASRAADAVFLTLGVPVANVAGDQPGDIARVEVYAVTAVRPPALVNGRVLPALTLVSSAAVRRPLPPPPPAPDGAPPVPVLPLEPGLDQGAKVTFLEVLTPPLTREGAVARAEPPPPARADDPDPRRALSLPLVFAPEATAVRRHYVAVAVSRQGRRGAWSEWRSVPVAPTSGAPGAPTATFDEKAVTIVWTPAPDATLSPAPPADGGLDSRPFGPVSAPTRYNVYGAEAPAAPAVVGAVTRPVPLNEAPLATPSFSLPAVTFGVERCFVVRGLDTVDGLDVEGPASPAGCVTPRDTFPPPPPAALEAVAGAGVISLIWEAVDAPDLAGYLVFRGTAPGEPATQLTPQPIGATSFEDRGVTAGERYVYVIIAVDSATPENRSAPSNRAEETARQ